MAASFVWYFLLGAEWLAYRKVVGKRAFEPYHQFLHRYPKGKYATEVQLRLNFLRARETYDHLALIPLENKAAHAELKSEIQCARTLTSRFTGSQPESLRKALDQCPTDRDTGFFREYLQTLRSDPNLGRQLESARAALEKGNIDMLLDNTLRIRSANNTSQSVDRLLAHLLFAATDKTPLNLGAAASYQYAQWMQALRKVALPPQEPLASQLISGGLIKPPSKEVHRNGLDSANFLETNAALACLRVSLLVQVRVAILPLLYNEFTDSLNRLSYGDGIYAFQRRLLQTQVVIAALDNTLKSSLGSAVHEVRDTYQAGTTYRARHESIRALERKEIRGYLSGLTGKEAAKWIPFQKACSAEPDEHLKERCRGLFAQKNPRPDAGVPAKPAKP